MLYIVSQHSVVRTLMIWRSQEQTSTIIGSSRKSLFTIEARNHEITSNNRSWTKRSQESIPPTREPLIGESHYNWTRLIHQSLYSSLCYSIFRWESLFVTSRVLHLHLSFETCNRIYPVFQIEVPLWDTLPSTGRMRGSAQTVTNGGRFSMSNPQ